MAVAASHRHLNHDLNHNTGSALSHSRERTRKRAGTYAEESGPQERCEPTCCSVSQELLSALHRREFFATPVKTAIPAGPGARTVCVWSAWYCIVCILGPPKRPAFDQALVWRPWRLWRRCAVRPCAVRSMVAELLAAAERRGFGASGSR
jgi:hypothetical protein